MECNPNMKLENKVSKVVFVSVLISSLCSLNSHAKEASDTMEVASDVAMCAAVYKFSAGVEVDSKSKKEFSKIQRKYEERVSKTLRSASTEILDYAFYVLTSEMQSARAKDAENGVLNLLKEHQQSCSVNFPQT